MNILITGTEGQLGHDINRALSPLHNVVAAAKTEIDVTDESKVLSYISNTKPDIIIHSADFTDVDAAEKNMEQAYMVNSFGTRNIALAAQKINAILVYISTDYVFDGKKKGFYTESDRTNPMSVYGHSKLHGEKFITIICDKYFILRTSWLYGKHGNNFVKKVIEKARTSNMLQMVDNQFGSPTYTVDLAEFISHVIQTNLYGLYHVANRGGCSRFEFTKEILLSCGMEHIELKPVSSSSFSSAAPRPENSALDDLAIRSSGMPRLREWKPALHEFLEKDLGFRNKGGKNS